MKQYNPKSMIMYISIFVFMSFIVGGVYSIIWFLGNINNSLLEWIGLIIVVLTILYFSYLIYRFINRKIVLFENKIYTTQDIGNRDVKLQYELEVMFNQIEKITLSLSTKNSLNQNLRFVITPMPYIVLQLASGHSRLINVHYYSKKQTIEIIDFIIKKKQATDPNFINESGTDLMAKLVSEKNTI